MVGATGATVSMAALKAVEAAPVLPAASVAVALKLWAAVGKRRCRIGPSARTVCGAFAE